ncbi:MAG: cyclic nucleotide-binding domain-containing protein [Planctomycetota bacterium]
MNALELVGAAPETVSFPAGALIFQEGAAGRRMFVVKKGSVEIMLHGRTVDVAEPGAIIGEMAMIDAQPRSASAIAAADCELVPLDRERFLALVRETPAFALHVMGVLADRLRLMDERS